MKGNTSLCQYIGGKYRLAEWIISLFPSKYPKMTYIEVFGGMANVLFQKTPSIVEIYNDKNEELTNLFIQIKTNTNELIKQLDAMPRSEVLFDKYVNDLITGEHKKLDDTTRAARYFFISLFSFSGMNPKKTRSFKVSVQQNIFDYAVKIKKLSFFADRLRNVQIINRDFEFVLTQYDKKNVLFYCDPPYYGCEHYYSAEFKNSDHYKLAEILNNIEHARVYLSYYDFDGIDELYPPKKWVKYQREVSTSAALCEGKQRKRAVEVLLCNKPVQKLLF